MVIAVLFDIDAVVVLELMIFPITLSLSRMIFISMSLQIYVVDSVDVSIVPFILCSSVLPVSTGTTSTRSK